MIQLRLALLGFLLVSPHIVQYGAAHGAMDSPKPRNNNPKGTVKYGIKFRKIQGGVAWDDFNVHNCVGGYQTAAEFTWDVCSYPARNEHNRPAYIVSQVQPSTARKIVDCTHNNDCSTPRAQTFGANHGTAELLWLTVYEGSNCSSSSAMTYKLDVETCTQFPVSGSHYWTGGCAGYSCMWFSQGCTIGCPKCTGNTTDVVHNLCGSTKKPTLDPEFRTFNIDNKDPRGDWTRYHPWRAPGNAPVMDACGVAGGFTKNNEGPGGHPPPGYDWGDKGSGLPIVEHTVWEIGSTVKVSWGIAANHGGGYQYRLCPKSELLTEECFQRSPLPFASGRQTLLLSNGTAVEIEGKFTSTGTTPEGSTWAMNPVPACGDAFPGTYGKGCKSPQFPPPSGCDESCWGDSDETMRSHHHHAVLPTIVDHLVLPAELAPGEYVLGWRWDCEQTAQIWASCSDVTLVPHGGNSLFV